MAESWALAVKNLLLPIFCKACGLRLMTEENGFFCPTCWELSPRIEPPFCTVCGRPHPGVVGLGMRINFPCTECREKGPQPYRHVFGAALYEGAVAEAIKLFKFSDKQRLAGPLGEVMTEFARTHVHCGAYDYVVPVPLYKLRERDRGFNQARLLAQSVLPVFPNAQLDESLRRIRPTKIQSRLGSEAERQANVVGAFAVQGDSLARKTVLLVDDVVTTGGTITECARALRRAGVGVVDVFAAALVGEAGASRGTRRQGGRGRGAVRRPSGSG